MSEDNKVRVDVAGLQWFGKGDTKFSHDGKEFAALDIFAGIPEPQDYAIVPVEPGDSISFPKGCLFKWREVE